MGPQQTLDRIGVEKLVMVVRAHSADDALRAVEAARAGGVRAIEVTFTVPGALGVMARLVAENDPELVVGAGTVLSAEQAHAAIDAGASFLVSPGLDEALLALAESEGALMIPGIFTASEAMRATANGARAVKLFPSDAVGPGYLKALLSPLPTLKVMPSGGVGPANAGAWLAAGAVAVGMAGRLSPLGPVDAALAGVITAEARASIASVAAA